MANDTRGQTLLGKKGSLRWVSACNEQDVRVEVADREDARIVEMRERSEAHVRPAPAPASSCRRVPGLHKERIGPGRPPQVVIVGAGFAGLAAAKRLGRAPVDVTVIDRRNYHLFQPLLYQVATAALSPAGMAAPIRGILRDNRNTEMLLDEVVGIDTDARRVITKDNAERSYDYLILATGSAYSYFGHEEWPRFAPGTAASWSRADGRNPVLLDVHAGREPAVREWVVERIGPEWPAKLDDAIAEYRAQG